jgi:polyhydroxyalkanoate synthesis regulator phasin
MAKKKVVKYKKESVTERLQKDEGSWVKLGEQLASQTRNMYGQLGDIYTYCTRLGERVEALEKQVAELQSNLKRINR